MPIGIDCRAAARCAEDEALSDATGDEDRPMDERLLRMRGRSALIVIASVWARSEGSDSFEDDDDDAGRLKLEATGVVSSRKLVVNGRGVDGSGVCERCSLWSAARRPDEKKDE